MKQQQQQQHCITLEDVQKAAERIQKFRNKTPVLTSTSINQLCLGTNNNNNDDDDDEEDDNHHHHRQLFFKIEAMQRTGSFKFRGALNATLHLLETNDDDDTNTNDGIIPNNNNNNNNNNSTRTSITNVVTHSSGNHAAALALAAQLASTTNNNKNSVHATIVMPRNAPQTKINGVRGFGGTIVMVDSTNEAREEEADRIVEETGAVFIHPSENVRVIAGQ
eukprot:CAMPEP_0198250512 /NCGR_PEP_ID=MMETSP1447-20131203/1678_1 /TAXON_ID=420782 /ORGANISM="Chaetoceros dichaeta, Strain CCMP1751" /LENGTH=220 /DNA_ID=CAMNT_0043935359 /DNA_START=27 /DNA_END=686 /DNA_ORIENTATION=-